MAITATQVNELRKKTGAGMMDCKKALEETAGDIEKAKILLRKISKQAADKKVGRSLGAGAVASYIHGNGSVGAMVELLCETDFVARNEDFKLLARDIAMHVTAMAPEFVKMEDVKEEDTKEEVIAKTSAQEIQA